MSSYAGARAFVYLVREYFLYEQYGKRGIQCSNKGIVGFLWVVSWKFLESSTHKQGFGIGCGLCVYLGK